MNYHIKFESYNNSSRINAYVCVYACASYCILKLGNVRCQLSPTRILATNIAQTLLTVTYDCSVLVLVCGVNKPICLGWVRRGTVFHGS
jgi:hypothetical protein